MLSIILPCALVLFFFVVFLFLEKKIFLRRNDTYFFRSILSLNQLFMRKVKYFTCKKSDLQSIWANELSLIMIENTCYAWNY